MLPRCQVGGGSKLMFIFTSDSNHKVPPPQLTWTIFLTSHSIAWKNPPPTFFSLRNFFGSLDLEIWGGFAVFRKVSSRIFTLSQSWWWIFMHKKQECIPGGCVSSAAVASVGVYPGGCLPSRGVSAPVHVGIQPPPWTEWQTPVKT